MANSEGKARTNYVHVENMEGLRKSLEPFPLIISKDNNSEKYCFLGDDNDVFPSYIFLNDVSDEMSEFDFTEHVMPYIKEGEVLITIEVSSEKMRYICGYACGYIREGFEVKHIQICLNDIYKKAAKEFLVEPSSISIAEY